MLDLLKCAAKNLLRKRARTAMTLCGIVIGVASVVVISGIGEVGKYVVNEEIEQLGVGSLSISAQSQNTAAQLVSGDIETIRKVEGVQDAIPILMKVSQTAARGLVYDSVVWGIDAGAKQVISLEAVHGRLINEVDVRSGSMVCLVDESYAQTMYERENIVGKTIKINLNGTREEFEVIGVVKSGGNVLQNLLTEYIPSFIYLPYTSMQRLMGQEGLSQIAVKVSDDYDVDETGEEIVRRLEANKGGKSSFQSENIARQKDKLNDALELITLILSAIAGISLIVAGLGIMTIMLVSVHERTREIGIKKAIGAGKITILVEFIAEALTLSLIGSCIGCLVGSLIVWAGCSMLSVPYQFSLVSLGWFILFAVVVGGVFGVYPAMQAARLRPVDALRSDG